MAAPKILRFRLSIMHKGKVVYVTDFDAEGTYSHSADVRDAVVFDDLNRVYAAKAFLEACNPLKGFAIMSTVPIPCHVLGVSAASLLPLGDG